MAKTEKDTLARKERPWKPRAPRPPVEEKGGDHSLSEILALEGGDFPWEPPWEREPRE